LLAVNQVSEVVGEDDYETSYGGDALKFYSSTRCVLSRDEDNVEFDLVKSSFAPPSSCWLPLIRA